MPIQQLSIRKMNQDLDESLMNQTEEIGNVRYAYNIRTVNSEGGAVGVATNVKGNLLVTYSLPSGGNKVVGSCSDTKNKRVYYLVWNSLDTHSLLEYDETSGDINLIFEGEALELSETVLIKSVRSLDTAEGTLIMWTDGLTEPKKVNRETGLRTFDFGLAGVDGINTRIYNPSFTTYNEGQCFKADVAATGVTEGLYYLALADTSNNPENADGLLNDDWAYMPAGYVYKFDAVSGNDLTIPSERISRMPQAPLEPPVCLYETDRTLNSNNLTENAWQFAYKYRYFDGQESHLSPWSNVSVAQVKQNSNTLNSISVKVDVDPSLDISDVIIYAQGFQNDNTKFDASLFKKIKEFSINDEIEKSASKRLITSIKYNFTNRETKLSTNPIDSQQLFYNVPVKSGTMALTSSNRVVDGDVTEGYDTPLVNPIETKVTSIEQEDYTVESLYQFTANPSSGGFGIDFDDYGSYAENQYIVFNLDITEFVTYTDSSDSFVRKNYFFSYTTNSSDDASTVASYFESELRDLLFEGQEKITVVRVGNAVRCQPKTITSSEPNIVDVLFEPREYGLNGRETAQIFLGTFKKSFKRKSIQKLGIAYFDKYGRVTSVVSDDSMSLEVGTQTGSTAENNGAVSGIKMYINHIPDESAVKYSIFKNKTATNFVQVPTSRNNTNNPASLNNSNNPNLTGGAKLFC